ncbi:MAG: response regulator [Clostridia bacterium]|nr:response regulator [Clostridia bacterium]
MPDIITVVDDDALSLKLSRRVLEKAGFEGRYLSSGAEALACFDGSYIPDLILLDVHMPDMNGFEILKRLKADPAYRSVPVVFLTGDDDVATETEGLNAGASDFLRKPFAAPVLIKRVQNMIELRRLHEDMAKEIRIKTEKLSHAYMQIVEALAASVDAKDKYTHGHSSRVALYSKEIAKRAGFSEAEQDNVYMMGLLHDVGKIGIKDAIINKPAKLTDEEYAVIKTHPAVGAEILKKITDFPELAVGARWHHERYDGRGYPDGLSGDKIPEVARIIAVADTYDAMTSNRSYRGVLPQVQVRDEIKKCKGTQFDPCFADIMLEMIDEDKSYSLKED